MKGKAVLAAILAAGVAAAWLRAGAQPEAAPKRVTVLYTNNTNGILRSCGCPGNPQGSLPQRYQAIEDIRKQGEALLLDGGDLLPPVVDDDLRLSYLLRLIERFHYDGIGLGDQEFVKGRRHVEEELLSGKLPFLAANVRDRVTKKLLAKPVLRKNVGGVRVLVVGIASPNAFAYLPKDVQDTLEVLEPAAAVREALREQGKDADLIVVLSHQGEEEDRALAAAVPGIHVIVGGHSQTKLDPPLSVSGVVIVQTGKNSEYLGALRLTRESGAAAWNFENRFIPLDNKQVGHPEIEKVVKEYERTMKELTILSGEVAAPYESQRCATCHEGAHRMWLGSRHRVALASIHGDSRMRSQDCLMCHATKVGMTKGEKEQPMMVADIQCWACHKMQFPEGEGMHRRPVPNVTAETCMACHTKKDSPHFNFQEYWKKIKHGKD